MRFSLVVVLLKDLIEQAKREQRLEKKRNRSKDYYHENKNKKNKKKSKKRRKPQKKPKHMRTTGFYAVYLTHCKRCSNGHIWTYDDGVYRINRVDFFELKHEIERLGLKWEITNRNDAFYTSQIVGYPLYDLIYK